MTGQHTRSRSRTSGDIAKVGQAAGGASIDLNSAAGASCGRRSILRGSLLAGAPLLVPMGLASSMAGAQAADAGGATASDRSQTDATSYFDNSDLNLQVLRAFSSAAYGAAEFGEVAMAVNRIAARGADYDAFYDEFYALAAAVREVGDACLAKGNRASARRAYLRAAKYFSQALFVVLGTKDPTREAAVYRTMQDCWNEATTLFEPPFIAVEIPYEGTTMPGYLLKADTSDAPRPVVILNNGSDAQNVDLYVSGGAAALERGYHALIFEGPGQGSMLFERQIPTRPDWEKVVTPVVDFLRARPDVDSSRIAIVGWSFGGLSVARAAAFEHRLAAVSLDPGVVDYITAWPIPQQMLSLIEQQKRSEVNEMWNAFLPKASPQLRFTIAKRGEIFGKKDFYDLVRYMQRFNVEDVVDKITAPTLVMEAELEEYVPGQSQQLFRLLTSPKKLVTFKAAEGAQFHCEPMAPQRRNQVLFDWLDETLGV